MNANSNGLVTTEHRNDVAWITMNRPQKLNALSVEFMDKISAALSAAENDDTIKVIVLRGTESVFSVGYDIAEEVAMGVSTAEQWHAGLEHNIGLSMQVWKLKKPVIAAVSGWALAGGCELAMACDMIIASDGAKFGEPEIRFGSGPVTLLMPFLIGQKATNELLYTGDVIDALRAEELGMINRVVSAGELEITVEQLSRKIALTPLSILRYTKRTITRAFDAMGLSNAVESNLDIAAVLNSADTPERAEFTELVATQGLRAALAWRDERYGTIDA